MRFTLHFFHSTSVHYKIIFPADYKNIPPLRDLVFHAATLQGFDHQRAEHLRSVVDELCNNAIEYGSQPTSEITLEVHADEKKIKIACQDQGHGNKLKADDIKKLIEQEIPKTAARGRGIPMIIKGFMNDFTLEDRPGGGITATATMDKGAL